ncbi:peroxide stress protein YaaA [Ramlibacter humi]|uniref:UPF0246 protein EZ216_10285 n=1 Tax=Ramlibacter humi TaxID=2530451 RepID=A0A4Z0BZP9_9BURK|nr:peroxide stress protein YaaA [Ramlibacter humi]TFZ04014.1 peroxide stress protein YaaA [Ramlibacter humi]
MLFLISPAKTLDYESPLPADVPATMPDFVDRSEKLIAVLRRKSARQVSQLMDLSPALSELNVGRYRDWAPDFTDGQSRQAVLAFNGDVYDGLEARKLSAGDLGWAQQHLRILSGLHGVLRPLDRIRPYRLEMGTALKVGRADNLYRFWGPGIAERLNEDLAADASPVIVNLASQEYFRAVDLKALKARVVECVFEDWKDGWKVISFFAKKARGRMARFAITRRVGTPQGLEAFDLDGYRFDATASSPGKLVFRRKMQP